jgi:hypothetical protein
MVASQRSRLSLEPAAPRRNENLPAREPVAGIDHCPADEQKIVDAALIWGRASFESRCAAAAGETNGPTWTWRRSKSIFTIFTEFSPTSYTA